MMTSETKPARGGVRVFDAAFLDGVCAEAATTARRRKNANVHTDNEYPCHRLFNALQPGTYVRPHRHLAESKDETLLVVRGRLGAVIFDEAGQVLAKYRLEPGMAIDVPHGTWHTFCCLAPDTVFFEAKAGPYVPMTPEEAAPFAPAEAEADAAAAYLASMGSLF